MVTRDNPLVSFCVMSCNQRDYIEAAFRSALDQDYSPLEVIVSDEASEDGAWEIIQRIAAEYKGPHKIILNRNEHRLGTIGNWQKLCELSSGEILVKADGDDISYPYRVSEIVSDWKSSGRRAILFASSYDIITKDGTVAGVKRLPGGWDNRSTEGIAGGSGYFYLGAVFACHRSLFDDFPRVEHMKSSDCSVYEARGLMSRRTFLEDGVHHAFRTIARPLIKYRLGSGDTTGGAYRSFMARGAERIVEARKQSLKDLISQQDHHTCEYLDTLRNVYESHIRHQSLVLKLYSGKTFKERWPGYREVTHWMKLFSKGKLIGMIFLLPQCIGDVVFSILRKLK